VLKRICAGKLKTTIALKQFTFYYFILTALFILTGCSEHKQLNDKVNSQPDTVRPLVLKTEDEKGDQSGAILSNCIMLDNERIAVATDNGRKELANIDSLNRFVIANSSVISRRTLYIVYSNNTPSKKVADIASIVKAAKIDDYKVLTLEHLINLNGPLPEPR
jgi:hypothetical protein